MAHRRSCCVITDAILLYSKDLFHYSTHLSAALKIFIIFLLFADFLILVPNLLTARVGRGIIRGLPKKRSDPRRQSPARTPGRCSCPARAQQRHACLFGHAKVATAEGAIPSRRRTRRGFIYPLAFLCLFWRNVRRRRSSGGGDGEPKEWGTTSFSRGEQTRPNPLDSAPKVCDTTGAEANERKRGT